MFSHGIMTGLFFGLIGMVYGRTHTRMIAEMGGLAKVMPWLATVFYIAGLASLGLPGLSGFVAETHVFLGGFFGNDWTSLTVMRILTIIATHVDRGDRRVRAARPGDESSRARSRNSHFEELHRRDACPSGSAPGCWSACWSWSAWPRGSSST